MNRTISPERLMEANGNMPDVQKLVGNLALRLEIEEFLANEAHLLDQRMFREWLDLVTDDVEYWMPVRSTRARSDMANEFAKIGELAFFDDDKSLLEERVRKLDTGYSWAEDPPSRTRHIYTNLRILDHSIDDEVDISCNFIVYRTRLERDEDIWVGRRDDKLRRVNGSWRLAKRHIFLDQVSVVSKNMSILF